MFYRKEITFAPDELLEYLRKSRSDDPLLSVEELLERHESILDDWAEKFLGSKVPDENKYREDAISGETIQSRPTFQEVLRKIESPKIKGILVVDVQRLSRGDLEDAGRLIKLLRYTKTYVVTPQKIYDLEDEYDRELFERELKRGNEYLEYTKKIMKNGQMVSLRMGNYIGSIAPYGYDKVFITEGKKKYPTLQINEEQAEVVRMIFDMYVNKDMGRINICHALDGMGIKAPKGEHWSPPGLKDMLENVHYIGKIKWNWRKNVTVVEDGEIYKTRPKQRIGDFEIFEGRHQAIISEELFQAAQEKQGRNHRAKAATKIRNPLASLVFCQCGTAMTYRTYLDKEGNERNAPRLLCNNQVHCHTSSVTYDEMIERIVDILENYIADFEIHINNNNKDVIEQQHNLIKRLEAKLEELKRKEINQWEKYSEEGMPKEVFDRLNEKVLNEKENVTQAIISAKEATPNIADYEEKKCRFQNALDALKDKDASAQQKNKLLKACIERIEYKREKSGRYNQTPFEIDVKLKV